MRLVGQDVLSKPVRKHTDARRWVEAWVATVEDAEWQSLDDVRADYPSADGVKLRSRLVVTVFNVKGNEYRLLTNINYENQVVLVLEFLRMPTMTRKNGRDGINMPVATKITAGDRYMELIGQLPLRRIKSAAAHARAKAMVLRLSSGKADRGTADYLDVLVDLIADYEKRAGQAIDSSKISAADLVRHRIDERGMTISSMARQIGLPQSNLSEMLSGKRDWSKTAICGLSAHLNIRTDRFLA